MRTPIGFKVTLPLLLFLVLFSLNAHAEVNSAGLFDDVLTKYSAAAASWAGVITDAASRLFWTLVTISMVWTFGMMALRKADIAEFFAELVRFIIFTGFFWWLLTNGPSFASSIYASLRQIAGNATGLGNSLSPSGIVDVGFEIFYKVLEQSSVWKPADSTAGLLMALAILVILALVGVNMLLLLASGWVLAYGGVFFLGFGGSRWTSDMAINYYKTVLGIGAQLMAMVLLVGIGKTFLDDYYGRMTSAINLKEMSVILIVCVILLALVNKIPALIAGLVGGGAGGIGQLGAGAALGAAGMAAAAAATGGAMIAAGAASAAGGGQALLAAFSKASENVSSGSDVLTSMLGTGQGGSGPQDTGNSTGSSPFADAAGFSNNPSDSVGFGASGDTKSDVGDTKGSGIKNDTGEPNQKGSSPESGAASDIKPEDGNAKGSAGKPTGNQSAAGRIFAGATQAAAKAGKIAADAGANLAKGAGSVAKVKVSSMKEAAMDRISDTTGGKIAAAIRGTNNSPHNTGPQASDGGHSNDQQQTAPTFSGNSLSGDKGVDAESEVAAFANRTEDNKTA